MRDVPIWERELITLEEAAAYSGIGLTKLRTIVNERDATYVTYEGRKRLIVREEFDEYLLTHFSI